MYPLIEFGVERSHPREWVITLDKNPYGSKDAGLLWFDKLKEGLEERGFVQLQADHYVWYREQMVLLFYGND